MTPVSARRCSGWTEFRAPDVGEFNELESPEVPLQRNAILEADIVAIRGMRLMFEAGVELSRQVWLDQAGYCDFALLASPVHDGRYRWRVRFEDSSCALDARGDATLAARLWALIGIAFRSRSSGRFILRSPAAMRLTNGRARPSAMLPRFCSRHRAHDADRSCRPWSRSAHGAADLRNRRWL